MSTFKDVSKYHQNILRDAEALLERDKNSADEENENEELIYMGKWDHQLDAISTESTVSARTLSLDSDVGVDPPFDVGPQLHGIHGYLLQKQMLQKQMLQKEAKNKCKAKKAKKQKTNDNQPPAVVKTKWMVMDSRDKRYGPMNSSNLIKEIRRNPKITANSAVISNTLMSWIPISVVPDLSAISEAMNPKWIVKIPESGNNGWAKIGPLSQLDLERGLKTKVLAPECLINDKGDMLSTWTRITTVVSILKKNLTIPPSPTPIFNPPRWAIKTSHPTETFGPMDDIAAVISTVRENPSITLKSMVKILAPNSKETPLLTVPEFMECGLVEAMTPKWRIIGETVGPLSLFQLEDGVKSGTLSLSSMAKDGDSSNFTTKTSISVIIKKMYDDFNITTNLIDLTLPPTPDEPPPLPDNMHPLSDDMPPLPDDMPPLPDNMPPLPDAMPSLPDGMPPLPDTMPPLPGTMPPLPGTMPPLPESMPPLPGTMPSLPDALPSAPDNMPLLPDHDTIPPLPQRPPMRDSQHLIMNSPQRPVAHHPQHQSVSHPQPPSRKRPQRPPMRDSQHLIVNRPQRP